MKCEHCGRKEATFYYRSNVNGRVHEAHLCQNCAAELGYDFSWENSMEDLFSFFPRVSGDDFAMPRLTRAAQRTLRVPPAEEEHEKPLLSPQEQQKLRRQREKNALRVALDEALDAEDYERAASLRDELRRLD